MKAAVVKRCVPHCGLLFQAPAAAVGGYCQQTEQSCWSRPHAGPHVVLATSAGKGFRKVATTTITSQSSDEGSQGPSALGMVTLSPGGLRVHICWDACSGTSYLGSILEKPITLSLFTHTDLVVTS